MATLGEIEKLTKDYADSRDKLLGTVQGLHEKMEAVRRQYLPGIRAQVRIAKERKSALEAALSDSGDLFVRPRTIIIAGIRVGFEKAKGIISWESDETVVRLIKKHFPEQAELLIKTTEKPLKKPLAQLSVADLKRIGVSVTETGDAVIIKPTDTEIDKLVEALLDEKSGAEPEGAA
jgi:hypothetical protein